MGNSFTFCLEIGIFLTLRGNEELFQKFYLEYGNFCLNKLMQNFSNVNFCVICQITLGNVKFLSSKIPLHPPKFYWCCGVQWCFSALWFGSVFNLSAHACGSSLTIHAYQWWISPASFPNKLGHFIIRHRG